MTPPVSLRLLSAGRLSPVGEPIDLTATPQFSSASFVPDDYRLLLVNSGTAALSLAMSLAAGHAGIDGPEVILPAYGCPDLLAAAYYAGVAPVLVDIEPDSPRYRPESLRAALGDKTVAIVAVNFLGISENLASLKALARGRDILLIEDDAQYFPLASSVGSYSGDLVVHSFGRGKPISQLGGGALLVRSSLDGPLANLAATLGNEQLAEAVWRLQARLFNMVLRPGFYQLLLMMPFLQIGATRYHQLEAIQRLQSWRLNYLQHNVERYRRRPRQVQQQLDAQLEDLPNSGLVNLPRVLGCQQQPLLRYPLLCHSEAQCDRLYQQLQEQGLGVTRMYERPLADIEGIPHTLPGENSGAVRFSRRLLTLPVTSFVDQRRLDKIGSILTG